MDLCPECGAEVDGQETACGRCGHLTRSGAPILPFEFSEPESAFPEEPVMEVSPPPAETPVAVAVVPDLRPTSPRTAAMLVAVLVVLGGLVTLVLLRAHGAPAPAAATAESPIAEPSPSDPLPVSGPSPGEPPEAQPVSVAHVDTTRTDPPRWSADNRAIWLGSRSRGVVLEVAAENTVGVWMRNVRPSLVVRCTDGRTEVFVFTQSPARIEPGTEDHTVTVAIDDDDVITELWPDSVEHDALFAPDGAGLAKRLLRARSMRFGFTPHNAVPVVARFHVEGLDDLLRPSARECGWS